MTTTTDSPPPSSSSPTFLSLSAGSKARGPYQALAGEIYSKLRSNVIDNIVSEYWRTGYIWEHYNDVTGYGEGTHPFTGWSALVVAIMGEKYH